MLDVVAEQLRRLVPVRRAPRGVEERDVVRVRELLLRCPGELAEPDREHGAPHRVLERLPRAEIGRERQRADDLRGADRLLDGEWCHSPRLQFAHRHNLDPIGSEKALEIRHSR